MLNRSAHHPIEIFGYSIDNKNAEAQRIRAKYWCPFMNKTCDKQSRTISFPMGVCSVLHMGNRIAICPNRFLQSNNVFADVCNEFWGSTNDVLLFKEVGLTNVGNFDFVLVKHKPISSKVDDFCVVEFQTDSTTQTGKLVDALKEFLNGIDVSQKRYNYGMNTYNTIKLAYIQMLYKGQVLEKWNKKIVWICQKYVFENTVNRFTLSKLNYRRKDSTVYFIYDLFKHGNLYDLRRVYKKSSTVTNLLTAFTKQPLPSIDDFIKALEGKIELNLGITLV